MATSDPGPGFKDALIRSESPDPDVGSQATASSNSDDEPLEGDNAHHIDRLLAKVLAPDERSAVPGTDEQDSADDIGSDASEDDASDDGAIGAPSSAAASDAEDAEEAAALKLHLYTLRQGVFEFEAWSRSVMLEAEEAAASTSSHRHHPQRGPPPQQQPPAPAATVVNDGVSNARESAEGTMVAAAAPNGGEDRGGGGSKISGEGAVPEDAKHGSLQRRQRAAASALSEQLASLRELQSQLKLLALNQQALCMHYTQHVLRVAHSQAELAMRHHDGWQRRHKQLRIVRHESARLCRSLEREQASRLSLISASASSSASSTSASASSASPCSTLEASLPHLWYAPTEPAAPAPDGSGGPAGLSHADLSQLVKRACGRAGSLLGQPASGQPATGQPAAAMVQDKAPSSARPSTARPARGGGHGASGAATSTSFSMYAGQGHAQPPAHPGRGGQRLKSAESGRLDAAAAESARKVLRQPAVQAAIAQAMAELLGEHAGGGAGAAADTP